MRSLSKPPKAKPVPQNKQEQKEGDKKNLKAQSKKVVKTTFFSPFRYKIQSLSLQDSTEVLNTLINYAKQIRSEVGVTIKKMENQKFISFNSKVKHEKPPLTTEKLVYGVSKCIKRIKNNQNSIKTVVFFYDENQHQMFEQLMCLVLYHKITYLIARESQNLRQQLGIKRILALGLTCEDLSNHLLKYASRNLLQIPWLVDKNWIPLEAKN